MLVLTRHVNERIVIDGGIVVTVCEIDGGRVRLGIEAPKETKVLREEVWLREQKPPVCDGEPTDDYEENENE